MKDLKKVIITAIKLLKSRRSRFLRILALPIAVYIGVALFGDWAYMYLIDIFQIDLSSKYLFVSSLILISILVGIVPTSLVSIYIAILIHREILIKTTSAEHVGFLSCYFMFIWKAFLISLMMFIVIIPFTWLIYPLVSSAGFNPIVSALSISIFGAILISFFSLVFPATAIGRKMFLLESAKLVLRNKALMFGIACLPLILVMTVSYLLSLLPLYPYVMSITRWIFHIGLLVFEMCCLSIAYHLIMTRFKKNRLT